MIDSIWTVAILPRLGVTRLQWLTPVERLRSCPIQTRGGVLTMDYSSWTVAILPTTDMGWHADNDWLVGLAWGPHCLPVLHQPWMACLHWFPFAAARVNFGVSVYQHNMMTTNKHIDGLAQEGGNHRHELNHRYHVWELCRSMVNIVVRLCVLFVVIVELVNITLWPYLSVTSMNSTPNNPWSWCMFYTHINSLAPGKFEWNFRYITFKRIFVIDGWCILCEFPLIWMSLDFTDDQSMLAQVMVWYRQAISHYLSQCWPRPLSPCGVTKPV